jgi:hypothetical protein
VSKKTRPPENTEPKEFMFSATITLTNATVFITANSRERAIELMREGIFNEYKTEGASVADIKANEKTITENV